MTAPAPQCQPSIVERLRADTRSAAHCALSEEAADRIEELEAALREIVDPIHFMRDRLKTGERLDGMMANTLARDPGYLKQIARAALPKQEPGT